MARRYRIAVVRQAIGLAMAWACALLASHPIAARTVSEIARLESPDRQRILEDGAKAEGKVLLYTSMVVQQAVEPIKKGFERKYPFLTLEFLRANSAQLVQRVLAENRARSNQSDVVVAGAGPVLAQTGFTQPFSSPALSAYPKNHVGPGGSYAATRFSYEGIGYNTRLVEADEAPQSYQDLLNPKWRGKMVWSNSQETGAPFFITQMRHIMGEDKALAYFKALSQQQIATQNGSLRSVLDQVIAGEYSIGIAMALHHIGISKAKGAPIDGTLPDPVLARADDIVLLKAAPHPYAGMLLVDFILSEKGQKIFADAQYFPAHSGVQPLPEMRNFIPHDRGKSESIIDDDVFDRERARSTELFRQFFQ